MTEKPIKDKKKVLKVYDIPLQSYDLKGLKTLLHNNPKIIDIFVEVELEHLKLIETINGFKAETLFKPYKIPFGLWWLQSFQLGDNYEPALNGYTYLLNHGYKANQPFSLIEKYKGDFDFIFRYVKGDTSMQEIPLELLKEVIVPTMGWLGQHDLNSLKKIYTQYNTGKVELRSDDFWLGLKEPILKLILIQEQKVLSQIAQQNLPNAKRLKL